MLHQMNTELLKQKAEMLEEYFGIHVDVHGNLSRIPVILDQYTPDMDRVPEFVLCLGNDVGSKVYSCLFFYGFSKILIFCMMILDLKGIFIFCSKKNVTSPPTHLETCTNTLVHVYRHICVTLILNQCL